MSKKYNEQKCNIIKLNLYELPTLLCVACYTFNLRKIINKIWLR